MVYEDDLPFGVLVAESPSLPCQFDPLPADVLTHRTMHEPTGFQCPGRFGYDPDGWVASTNNFVY